MYYKSCSLIRSDI